MKVMVYDTWDRPPTEIGEVPNVPGNYTVSSSQMFLTQSDRIKNDPDFGYLVGMHITVDVTLAMSGSQMTVTVNALDGWKVERIQTASRTPPKEMIQGDYEWYSTINGALIYHYIGPQYTDQGGAEWTGQGGTTTFTVGPFGPQQDSARTKFAHFHNNVNGNEADAYIYFFNDLPPDYRPGQCLHSNVWESHNRDGGSANILTGGSWVDNVFVNGTWVEMRTEVDGHDNPPLIRRNNGWDNQAKIGANA